MLSAPEITVTLAVADRLPEVALTSADPAAVATKNPPIPINPVEEGVTDQLTGATDAVLSKASFPIAVNCCPLSTTIVTELGVTAIVIGAPAVPVTLNVTGDPDSPVDVAVTVFVPAVVPSVSVVEAFPSVPVVAEVADRDPFPAVMANVTLTPLTGLLLASFAITTKGKGSVVATVAF
jgi:hypothetical protein